LKTRREFLNSLTAVAASAMAPEQRIPTGKSSRVEDRVYWLDVLRRLAEPVLTPLSRHQLKAQMPIESAQGLQADRSRYSHLEALGRLLAGIAPWLELGGGTDEEGQYRHHLSDLAREAIAAATDPNSPDLLNFTEGAQPLVDAAFLAQAMLRAPRELWEKLDSPNRQHLLAALRATRSIKPYFNNWLLFSATIEAAFCQIGTDWDALRIDYALRQHDQWYKGDGAYGDGPQFHWGYYNSFVIYPMMLDILRTVPANKFDWEPLYRKIQKRSQRYAVILERMISPEGTYPAVGRSLAYRFGAFQVLAQLALFEQLPEQLNPAQVRSALTAVIRRMMEAPGTFDSRGWLTIGLCGHQPSLGETYISTGSLYLCSAGLLPLGLPPHNEFWEAPPELWTACKIWGGQDLAADHALTEQPATP
jgi:hypothetical protein